MSGFIHSLLVLAGLRAPRRAPSARLRGKGGAAGQAGAGKPGRTTRQQGRPGPAKPASSRSGAAKGAQPRTGQARAQGLPRAAGQQPRPADRSPAGARRQEAPAPMHASVDEALDDVFGDLSPLRDQKPTPTAAQPRPRRRAAQAETRPARRRSVSGLGMFALATLCLSVGGWAGSQVQAYAYGAARELANPAEMRSIDPPNDYKF